MLPLGAQLKSVEGRAGGAKLIAEKVATRRSRRRGLALGNVGSFRLRLRNNYLLEIAFDGVHRVKNRLFIQHGRRKKIITRLEPAVITF